MFIKFGLYIDDCNGIFNDLPDYSYDDPMGLEISIIENLSSKRQTLPSNNYNYITITITAGWWGALLIIRLMVLSH